MRTLVSLGVSCGILVGLLVQFSGALGILAWVAFAAWACYYAAGGKKEALLKIIPANLSGVAWGVIILFVVKAWGVPYAIGVVAAVAVALMCVQASWSVLGFIPGTFIGVACFLGANADWQGTSIALVIGAILGFVSEQGAGLIGKIGAAKA